MLFMCRVLVSSSVFFLFFVFNVFCFTRVIPLRLLISNAFMTMAKLHEREYNNNNWKCEKNVCDW